MEEQNFFIQALIYLSAAVISVPLAKRLGLGSVLGYLLAGIIIGPYLLGLIGEEGSDVMHFAEFGVVMMLFLIGLELKPSLLWKMRRSIFGLGGMQVLITAVVIAGIAIILRQQIPQAISIGLILALSSTAIVIQTLSEKGLLKNTAGQSAFSVLLFQDIAFIPILAILPLLVTNQPASNTDHAAEAIHQVSAVSFLPGWQQLFLILGAVTAIVITGRYFARYIFRFIASSGLREIFTAAALLMVILIAFAMEKVGLSPALGTFLAGVVLADSEYRHEIESDIEPFKGLLLGLFFIAVGAGIDFGLLLSSPLTVAGLLISLIAIKFIILFVLARSFGLRSGQDMLLSFALAQGGEFAFVLIAFTRQNGILTADVSNLLLITVALSMALTPLLLIINDKLVQPRYTKFKKGEYEEEIMEKENPVIIAGFGRFGLVVGRLLIANGFQATVLDNNPDNIQILRKFGMKVYYGDATRPDLLTSAGIGQAAILVIALDDRQKAMQIVEFTQRNYPHIKILARAHDIPHAFELLKHDVEDVSREVFDAALELGVKALHALGYEKYQAHRAAKTFKHHDEMVMSELYQHWFEDKKKYIEEARRFSLQIEEILTSEKEQSIHESDGAWDTTTLREEIREIVSQAEGKNSENNKNGK